MFNPSDDGVMYYAIYLHGILPGGGNSTIIFIVVLDKNYWICQNYSKVRDLLPEFQFHHWMFVRHQPTGNSVSFHEGSKWRLFKNKSNRNNLAPQFTLVQLHG